MRLHLMNANLTGRDEIGTVRAMLIGRRLSLDIYTWPSWRWNWWWMPSMGILWNCRAGRVEWQIRWR